jgi:NAD(P)H-nitrite reductase large subunit
MDDTIVCRCSDVTLGEIRKLIAEGYTTFDEIKRVTRVGMGPCQGKTCGDIIRREIALATGKKMSDVSFHHNRPPAMGVRLELIAKEAFRNEEQR